MSDSPSVCRGKKNPLPINVFSWKFYVKILLNCFVKTRASLIFDTKKQVFYIKTNIQIWYLAEFFLEWEMFHTQVFYKTKKKKSSVFNIVFEHSAVYEIMYKNMVGANRSQTKIWGMHIACWIPEAKTTQPEYVTVIIFPRNKGCTNELLYHFFLSSPFLSYRKKFYRMWRNYLISKK